MKNRATFNYIVDIMIGLGFLIAAFSGILLLFMGSGGYQGGRNPAAAGTVLFLARKDWKTIHDWAGLIMIAGTLGHLILHWNWIVCMTKNIFRGKRNLKKSAECAV